MNDSTNETAPEASNEEITYHAVEKDGVVTAIWEMQGRKHLRGEGVPTVAVDLAPAMATVAYHRNRVPSAAGTLTALPLADGSLAAAVVFYAVIHLDDAGVAAAAGELARVLRPGGVALVSIHIGDEVRHVDEWHGEPVDLDFRFLLPGTLRRVLRGVGLVVEAILEREPIPDVEAQTRRAYLLARRR